MPSILSLILFQHDYNLKYDTIQKNICSFRLDSEIKTFFFFFFFLSQVQVQPLCFHSSDQYQEKHLPSATPPSHRMSLIVHSGGSNTCPVLCVRFSDADPHRRQIRALAPRCLLPSATVRRPPVVVFFRHYSPGSDKRQSPFRTCTWLREHPNSVASTLLSDVPRPQWQAS